jgi:hypothetical protein
MSHVWNQNMERLIIWLWAVAALARQFRYLVFSGFPIVCFLKMKPSLLLSTSRWKRRRCSSLFQLFAVLNCIRSHRASASCLPVPRGTTGTSVPCRTGSFSRRAVSCDNSMGSACPFSARVRVLKPVTVCAPMRKPSGV